MEASNLSEKDDDMEDARDNPYWWEWDQKHISSLTFTVRRKMTRQYAWAIPDPDTLAWIASIAPHIIDWGAGTGYWAGQLARLGVDVLAYDTQPYQSDYTAHQWYPITTAADTTPLVMTDRTLFLCWPPYDEEMAVEALRAFGGTELIYIGEKSGGCTASDAFFDLLERDWECITIRVIPTWPMIHDLAWYFQRKNKGEN